MRKISFAEFGGPEVLRLVEAEEPHAPPVGYASPYGRRGQPGRLEDPGGPGPGSPSGRTARRGRAGRRRGGGRGRRGRRRSRGRRPGVRRRRRHVRRVRSAVGLGPDARGTVLRGGGRVSVGGGDRGAHHPRGGRAAPADAAGQRRVRRRRVGGAADRPCARHHGDRHGRGGEPGLPARPGRPRHDLRRGVGRTGAAPGPGRRGPRPGRLGRDPRTRRTDRGPAQGRLHRRPRCAAAGRPVLRRGGERSGRARRGRRPHLAGELHIPVEMSYALSEAAAAHADSRAGHTRGRRVLVIGVTARAASRADD